MRVNQSDLTVGDDFVIGRCSPVIRRVSRASGGEPELRCHLPGVPVLAVVSRNRDAMARVDGEIQSPTIRSVLGPAIRAIRVVVIGPVKLQAERQTIDTPQKTPLAASLRRGNGATTAGPRESSGPALTQGVELADVPATTAVVWRKVMPEQNRRRPAGDIVSRSAARREAT